ncbi:MAG: alpha/beta hydrolase [Massiliimalia sp.]
MNKAMRAALKALSYPDIDIKKTYKLHRSVINLSASRFRLIPIFHEDIQIPVDDHTVPVRLFFPTQEKILKAPVIVFFHGGGWVTGNVNTYNRVCATMAKSTNMPVLSVDYRLAPEHRFPSSLEDCYGVIQNILNQGVLSLKLQPHELVIAGDSAGGNLAAAVSLLARDRGEFSISNQILIYPATYNDHTEHSPFPSVRENGTDYLLTSRRICDYMELYVSSPKDYQSPYFAPLLAESLRDQPNTLIITAEYDPLRDEGEAYGFALELAGNQVRTVRMPDVLHGFFSLPIHYEPVQQTYDIINEFLKERFST